jgi:quercetin dioxygenase-like cupin family protein
MSTTQSGKWISDWTAEDPIQIGYVAVAHDGGTWTPGLRPYLQYRNLGVEGVSEEKVGVQHIRFTGDEAVQSDWHVHDLDFQFVYVLSGSIEIENRHGETVTLGPHDTGYTPGLFWHREKISPGYSCIEITGPARGETITGLDSPLPERAATLDPDVRANYTFESPDAYVKGNGPRKFFLYRDLGTREPSENRLHIHVVKATEPGAGTGWHYHTMAQWFWILGGTAGIRVEDKPHWQLVEGDSMCIGFGEHMRHNVAPFSGDYAVLEMCVPAVYDTIAVPPPENCDAAPEGAKE